LDLLAREVGEWKRVWLRHPAAGTPWREGRGRPVGDPLPPLTPSLLREAAAASPATKGYSGFCARWFRYLDDSTLEAVCAFLMGCERVGMWPEAVQHAMLHLIPKREGGKRPIGLVDGLCRLWELARRIEVRRWRAEHSRDYDFGGRGRSSSNAVWVQALYNEAADFQDEAAVTVLLDLAKAFESVPLELVWERGIAMGFPREVLRLSLEVCSFLRHLTLEGVVEEGVQTVSAILAGTSFATDLLFMVMVVPCDHLREEWPRLNLSLVVDDLAVQAVNSKGTVGDMAVGATNMVMDELTAMGCMVSRGTPGPRGGRRLRPAPLQWSWPGRVLVLNARASARGHTCGTLGLILPRGVSWDRGSGGWQKSALRAPGS